jgi:hypothetical protein
MAVNPDPKNVTEALEALQKYAPEFKKQLDANLSSLNEQEKVVVRTVGKMLEGQQAQSAAAQALKETYGLLLKGAGEAEKTKNELKTIIAAYGKIMGEIKKISGIDEGRKRALDGQLKSATEYYKTLSSQSVATQRIILQQQQQLQMQRQALQNARETNRFATRGTPATPVGGPGFNVARMAPQVAPATSGPGTILSLGGVASTVGSAVVGGVKGQAVKSARDAQGTFDTMTMGAKATHKSLNSLVTGYTSLTGQVMNADQAVDRLNKNMPTFAGRVIQIQRELANLGVTMEETVKTFAQLHTESRTFGILMARTDAKAKVLTDKLSEQGMQFERLGITSADYSKSLDILGKTYKTSDIAGEAKTLNTELVNMARVTGQLPGQLSKDFANAMNTLSAYTLPQAKEIFKDLALEVTNSGVKMETLLKVAGKFDDMSAAADSVGELNAMLGGPYLNTLDMVNATEAERIQMLKDAMAQQGMNFNQMDRFMQKSIAQQLGVDVQEASRLFRGRSEDEKSATEKRIQDMAKQGKSFNDLMGKFQDGATRNAVAFEAQWKAAEQQAVMVESVYERINNAQHTSAQIMRSLGPKTRDFIGKHMLAAAMKLHQGLLIAAADIDKGLFGQALTRLFYEKQTFELGILKGVITEGMTGEVRGIKTDESPEGQILTSPPKPMSRKQRRDAAALDETILNLSSRLEKTLSDPREIKLETPIQVTVNLPAGFAGVHNEDQTVITQGQIKRQVIG